MKRIILLFTVFAMALYNAFAEPELSSYLKNDLELKRLALEVKKAALSLQKTSIENGLDVKLSTGTASFRFQNDSSSVSFKPSAEIAVPQASNLKVTASSSIKYTDSEDNSSDTSISLSVDLISGTGLTRKICLLQAERSYLEAKRNLQNRALEAEKEYYTDLKNLFVSASSITSLQNDLYDHTISFEEVKAKGYNANSAKYRQAQMKVLSDQHEIETKIHDLEHSCAVFASKCGQTYTAENPSAFLPDNVTAPEPVDILSFKKDSYTKIENAGYKHKLAELQRKADKNFTLTANGGYTIKNSETSFSSGETKSNTINAGLDAAFKGLSVGAGVSFPTESGSPTCTFSATVKPNAFRTSSIKEQTNQFTNEEELIAIQSAFDDYDTAVVDKQTELESLLWSKETNTRTYDMYVTLADDLQKLLKQGLVKESEYLNAFANKESYRFKLIINDIDTIIYNNSTKLLFCRDAELSE